MVCVAGGFETVPESWWTTYPTPTATSVTRTAAVTSASLPGVHFTAARYLAPPARPDGMSELSPDGPGHALRARSSAAQKVVPGTIGAGGVAVRAFGKVAVSIVASPMIIGWSVVLATSGLRSSM